ncbi:amino acid adenylation domain-containing protein, partial [Amycolatopsis sp.]|uniref:amino acid adenylation domain-containing protein n=1 Tax=Amycolatopsis sp. TaxID=37632 RepID=UPI002E02D5BC|nr:amino acid adenylation domain-containing protein [Amycolatopsis sp.]
MNSPAVPQARDRVTPAASIQERMWFAERMEPGTGLYNVPFAWRVRGTLSPEALQQALTLVIERHEILRTSFAEHDGRLRQLVAEPWTPVLERVDLRGTAADQELESWLRDFARRPFAMDGDRLLRVGLVELDGGRQVLALCAHHLVWDAASTPLFLRELRSCYETVGPGGFPAEDVPGDFDGLTESPTEAPAVLPVLFDRQANRLPGKTAVVFEDTALSYRDLDRRSSAVAAYLADRGIGRGDLVGVCLDRSADLVVALLGVLKSGAAYVPLDPIYPRDRISGMLEDAQVGLVLTQERLEPLAGSAIPVCLDRDWPRIEAAGYAEAAPVTGDDLAYVIYTSGSTGRPKGVRVTHHGLGNLLGSMAHRPGFGEHDTMLAVTTVCFDIAALELYLPLITGGTVEVAPNSVASDGEQLKRHLGRTRPSHLQATPATWRLLVAAGWTGDQWLTVFCGGEALSRELADELLDRSAAVWNLYGPTETTIWSTVSRVGRGGPVTIGRAIANTDLYLLDDALRPVPAGEVGELWIGGDGVADGYLRRPELTGERFRPSPFRPSPAMLYRTGDLVRELPDGRLLYVNRADNQIKLHGYRIEPGEIESCLRAHGSITEAAVLLENDRLAAYLQCAGPPPSPAELRARLGGTLPDYMIPSVFHAVDEFPLTDNGKLDRKAVRGLGTRLATGTGRAPSTPTARVVAAAFAQVLEVSEPDADDSFFELGGHSLLAARLVTELGARLGVRLSLRDLFEHPGVQDLADHLDTLAPQRQNPEESTEDAPGEPASSMQEQMWLAEQRHPDEPSYNVPLSWRVTGTLDAGALRTAFGTLIERHEILRTAFVEHAGRLRQVVRPGWLPEIEHTDLSAVAGHEAAIGALVDAEAGTAFDLGSGRPLRVRLVDRGADRLLMVCLHHMVFDAQSIPAFLRDLGNAYTRALGRPAPELPPVVQFGEVARWQREHLAGEDGQYSLDHWLDHLTAAPESLRLGAPPRQPEPHGAVRIPFGEDFAETSAPLQAEHRTSWFVIALAAVTAWLHRWSGSDDVTFGLPLGNRETEQAADVVGPCLNTVVLRARCKREMTFADLLTEMRESFLDALEHQAVPLPEVLERLAPRRHSGGSPYLDVGVNMVTNSGEATVFGDAVLTAVPFDRWQHETKFGLTVTFLDDGGKLGAVLSYRGDRHTAVEATELAHGLGALLDDVMAATSRALAQD